MNSAHVERIVNTLLYEGYMLYPYRPSVKNRQRWTFGGLYPRSFSDFHEGSEAWCMQTECLVQGDRRTALRVKPRFLHLLTRLVGELVRPQNDLGDSKEPAFRLVERLQIGDRLLHTWHEAVEREHLLDDLNLVSLVAESIHCEFNFPGNRQLEPVCEPKGQVVAVLLREQQAVTGKVSVCATRVADELFKVRVRIENLTHLEGAGQRSRDDALMRALVSTHCVLEVSGGAFVSLLDPPEAVREIAASCENVGCWPVLVGEAGEKDTMLAAPIILYDYPRIAPESAGNLFDSTEIDEILTLRIMTLTAEEKQTAAALDERTRAMLQRTDRLGQGELLGMHGVGRRMRASVAENDHE